jgi:putative hemolysin
MNVPWFEISILIALTGFNAFFTGSEIALVSIREGQLQRLHDAGGRSARVVALARNPTRFLASCQIAITLGGFFASATAAVSLAAPVEAWLSFLGGAADVVAVVLVTLVLAYFTLVFGELVPKRIAMQRSEQWARVSVGALTAVTQATRPVVWLLEKSTNMVVRALGSDPNVNREEVTEEEIRDLLEAQQSFTEEQRSIITGAFEIGERTLREVLVPRGVVVTVSSDATCDDALRLLARSGHSRAPVHSGDLDDVLGLVHVRDLVDASGPVTAVVRPATVMPESLNVLDTLRRLQSTRQQMAIVVNEHGGVEGIITVEDLLEEIVGEIYDEFDRDAGDVVQQDDGCIVLPGSFAIHDLSDVDAELPEGVGAYATVAGYVLDQLGHIPKPGEVARGDKWDVEVIDVANRAITKVRLIPVVSTDLESESANSGA